MILREGSFALQALRCTEQTLALDLFLQQAALFFPRSIAVGTREEQEAGKVAWDKQPRSFPSCSCSHCTTQSLIKCTKDANILQAFRIFFINFSDKPARPMHMFKCKQSQPSEPKSNIKRQSDFQTMIITFSTLFAQFKYEMEQDSYNLLAHKREETIVWIWTLVRCLSAFGGAHCCLRRYLEFQHERSVSYFKPNKSRSQLSIETAVWQNYTDSRHFAVALSPHSASPSPTSLKFKFIVARKNKKQHIWNLIFLKFAEQAYRED